jgi:hypothetical protein
MKTDDFITALAADLPTRPIRVPRALTLALLVSMPIALGLLFYALQVRADFLAAFSDARFAFKFIFTGSVVISAGWLALHLSRPGVAVAGAVRVALGIVLAVLLAGVGGELAALPRTEWQSALMGDAALKCMVLIPLLAAAPLVAVLIAMKSGAPDHPALAGAAGGLVSGAIGATLYASHCTNDSPLFVAVWYVIGIAAVTAIGSLIGARVLRW